MSISSRMAATKQRDNAFETGVRSLLHRKGLRFRVSHRIPGLPRRTCDIAFTRARIAVFLDGCFWHCCPIHGTSPKTNGGYWTPKLLRNVERDRETDAHLKSIGWTVLRYWEHEDIASIAYSVAAAVGASR